MLICRTEGEQLCPTSTEASETTWVGIYFHDEGKGRESEVPHHEALGCLAEGHGGEADLPLLALSDFSADLGGVLQP